MRLSSRSLFVAAIFAGSFLLFLIQPMVARLVLPRLGGAPNVWNSAMLVYQALLLGGYAYAHLIRSLAIRSQIMMQAALLVLASLTLPISLVDIPSFGAGFEVLWVPVFILASIGPVFFLVSAQAPLVQRWYSCNPAASDPYPLYAASNLGSFCGLLSYPLLIEPLLTLGQQAMIWSAGYAVLVLLVLLLGRARWSAVEVLEEMAIAEPDEPIRVKTKLLWLALAAVPSGLMLSTTTHLTTDIFAMPLLWVIPLGLYLLSFVPAFSENRTAARLFTRMAPFILLLVGGLAMMSQSAGGLTIALSSAIMLFVVSVALHGRLFDLRPRPEQLTLFYLVMSAGGVLGGLFTALIAPAMFDWVWEHPILVFAAAILLPLGRLANWQMTLADNVRRRLLFVPGVIALSSLLGCLLLVTVLRSMLLASVAIMLVMAALAIAVKFNRVAFLAILLMLMFGWGIVGHVGAYTIGDRSRSYFGVYNVQDNQAQGVRTLTHGTTVHGRQFLDPALAREPIAYYGRSSGVGLVLDNSQTLYGDKARIGVVGLGVGTLACYRRAEQRYRFYEIDPEVLMFTDRGSFTFLSRCAPEGVTVIGDARLALEREPVGQFDVLVVDAFSSDAIPLHLLTSEAIQVYLNALDEGGVLLIHISNRFIDLEPVLAAAALDCGCKAAIRRDHGILADDIYPSSWVLLASDAADMRRVEQATGIQEWDELPPPLARPWTDNYASILPLVKWNELMGFKR